MAVDVTPHPLIEVLGVNYRPAREQAIGDLVQSIGDRRKKVREDLPTVLDLSVDHLDRPASAPQQLAEPLREGLAEVRQIAAHALAAQEQPLDFVTLTGYLGRAASDDAVRLYFDPTLSSYVSLRVSDIVHRHRFATEAAPFDQVDVVWVKRNTPVGRSGRWPRGHDDESRFLEGDLMDAEDLAASLPTRIAGAVSDEPFCVTYTCCKRTSNCPPPRPR